jgi:hypothetical protein
MPRHATQSVRKTLESALFRGCRHWNGVVGFNGSVRPQGPSHKRASAFTDAHDERPTGDILLALCKT